MVVTGLVSGLLLQEPNLGTYIDRILSVEDFGPVTFLAGNLGLAALIPAAGLSIWAVHRIRPGFVSSVEGGLRWRWLLRCVLVVLPLWAMYLLILVLVEPPPPGRPPLWLVLMVIVVLTTPLQAAGEEYLFRGFLLQNLGAWFAPGWLSFVVPTTVSSALFAMAHGSPDPWVLADLAWFAVGAAVLTWRTGGLEAAIALHTVNNVLLFFVVVGFGGWEDAFVDGETTSTPGEFAVSAVAIAAAVVLLLWQARRMGVRRTFLPATAPALSASSGFVAAPLALGQTSGGLAGERPPDGRQA